MSIFISILISYSYILGFEPGERQKVWKEKEKPTTALSLPCIHEDVSWIHQYAPWRFCVWYFVHPSGIYRNPQPYLTTYPYRIRWDQRNTLRLYPHSPEPGLPEYRLLLCFLIIRTIIINVQNRILDLYSVFSLFKPSFLPFLLRKIIFKILNL